MLITDFSKTVNLSYCIIKDVKGSTGRSTNAKRMGWDEILAASSEMPYDGMT